MTRRYVYLGDRLTDRALAGQRCSAVLRSDGKCVLGRSAMLVLFDGEGAPRVVQRRLLRKRPATAGFPMLEDDDDEEDRAPRRRRTFVGRRSGWVKGRRR